MAMSVIPSGVDVLSTLYYCDELKICDREQEPMDAFREAVCPQSTAASPENTPLAGLNLLLCCLLLIDPFYLHPCELFVTFSQALGNAKSRDGWTPPVIAF